MIDRIVVINDLSQPRGGASQLALESAVQFARRGHRVTLICGSADDPALAADGIEVVALGQERLLEGNRAVAALRGLYNRPAATMVRSWIERNDTPRTIYHVHGWSQILSPALFHGLLPVKERTLVHAHDFFLTCPNGAMFHFGKDAPCPATPMSATCIASACDRRGKASKAWRVARHGIQNAVLANFPMPALLIHSGMKRYFARSGMAAQDMAVVPNPVRAFVPRRVPAEENRIVLFVGRLEATKGIDLAAEACRRAGVRLVAVGAGAMCLDLARRYPEMDWVGRRDHAGIGALAAQARVAVMPSRHIEPFGLAAVEALWSGLPVIASADSLLAPDIVNAGAGIALDPRDLDRFAAELRALFDDDARTRRMSMNAHTRTFHLALGPEQWIATLLDAYAGYLDAGRLGLAAAVRRHVPPVETDAEVVCAARTRAAPALAEMEES